MKPPPELQRTILPWIEDVCGQGNSAWVKTCLQEMDEIDENEDDGEDFNDDNGGGDVDKGEINIIMDNTTSTSAVSPGKKKPAAKPVKNNRVVFQDYDMAKRGFLRLLVRCRCCHLTGCSCLPVHWKGDQDPQGVPERSRHRLGEPRDQPLGGVRANCAGSC